MLPKRVSAAAGGRRDFGFAGGGVAYMSPPRYMAIIGSIPLLLCGSPNLNTTPLIGYTSKRKKGGRERRREGKSVRSLLCFCPRQLKLSLRTEFSIFLFATCFSLRTHFRYSPPISCAARISLSGLCDQPADNSHGTTSLLIEFDGKVRRSLRALCAPTSPQRGWS